jgi:hypothetical protein
MAFADAFRAIKLGFILATFLVPLLRKAVAPKVVAAGAHLT